MDDGIYRIGEINNPPNELALSSSTHSLPNAKSTSQPTTTLTTLRKLHPILVNVDQRTNKTQLEIAYFFRKTTPSLSSSSIASYKNQALRPSTVRRVLNGIAVSVGCIVDHPREDVVLKVISIDPPLCPGPPHDSVLFSEQSCVCSLLKEVHIDPRYEIKLKANKEQHIDRSDEPPLAGLDVPYQLLREMLVFPLNYGHFFRKLNMDCPGGIKVVVSVFT